MSQVLAALDDTGAASPVLRTARQLAEGLGRSLRVVHAGPWPASAGREAAALGVDVDVLTGPAEQELVSAAMDPGVDLVVMGLHRVPGRHDTGHLVTTLAGRVSVPIVVVPPCVPVRSNTARILFPLDGTRRVSSAARPLIRTAVAAGIEVLALHVYEPTTVPMFHDRPEDEEVWRDEFLSRHGAELDVRLTTRAGPLVPALLQAAIAHDVDIIAMPSQADAAPRRGSVVSKVLTGADRPVALVPLPRVMLEERSA